MNYCSGCAGKLTLKIPEGDDLPRFVCTSCKTIFYENPKMVAGALPEYNGTILLCRRAIEPAWGKWTLPAGYLENGETLAQCAMRETDEEAGAKITDPKPYVVVNLPRINQVYFIFRAQLETDRCYPGRESLEVKFLSPAEIPWEELAFSSIREVLKIYCQDTKKKEFLFQMIDVDPPR